MSLTAANVRVAVTGAIYNAPVATPLPTVATSALNAAFLARELGYLTEDGITQSIANDKTSIKAWQNAAEVRVIQTSSSVTFAMSLQETSPLTLETYYGNYTTLADGGSTQISGDALPHYAWVFHVIDGAVKIRIVVPDGQITERGDTQYVNADVLAYPIVITAYPDSSGVNAYKYLDNNILTSS